MAHLYVFTTRVDTIMGVTFCAVAPEHPLALHAALDNPALAAFIEECKQGGTTEAELAAREKVGMRTGLTVTHPLNGHKIEVWVGNYVLMSYGDGAVMGVPAHDERDFAFAKKYGIPIFEVVHVDGLVYDYEQWQDWYGDKQRGVTINSDSYSGLKHKEAVDAIAHALQVRGLGEKKTTWRSARLGCEPPALLGYAHPHHSLPRTWRCARARKRLARGTAARLCARWLRQPVAVPRRVPCRCGVPDLWCCCATRDGHHGHLCGLQLVLHAVLRPKK